MLIADLSLAELERRLRAEGLRLAAGAFSFRLRSDIAGVALELHKLYAAHPLLGEDEFIDFHVGVHGGDGLRRWLRPQAIFSVDGVRPFTPLPLDQAVPMLEWGMNWCITAYSQHVLILHAASLSRNGRAVILPAPPGSGKSTLCAALAMRGWQLLSDELTILDLRTGAIQGLARPINLKNASIDILRKFAPEAYLSPPVTDTSKGTVALLAPPPASVAALSEPAYPAWMVLPKYVAGAEPQLQPMASGAAFMQVASNAMNYHVLGLQGFEAVAALIGRSRHFSFSYSRLDDAIACFERLGREGA